MTAVIGTENNISSFSPVISANAIKIPRMIKNDTTVVINNDLLYKVYSSEKTKFSILLSRILKNSSISGFFMRPLTRLSVKAEIS